MGGCSKYSGGKMHKKHGGDNCTNKTIGGTGHSSCGSKKSGGGSHSAYVSDKTGGSSCHCPEEDEPEKKGGKKHLAMGGKKTKSKRKTKGKKARKTRRKTSKKSFLARLFKL